MNLWPRVCVVASVAALGRALQIANGFYDDRALTWLTVAFVFAIVATVIWRVAPRGPLDEGWLLLVTAMAVAWQIVALLTTAPGMYLDARANTGLFKVGVIAEAVVIGIGAASKGKLARAWFPALLALHVALGVWMLRSSPSPRIDVVTVHRAAFDALSEGRSPYDISFENIYGPNSGFYNQQLLEGDRVMFGYPYPPLSLLLAAPGHFIAGDYRYAQLAAWIVAAALIGYMAPSLFAKLAAALLLTQPRGFFVLEQGWTEPMVLLLLTMTAFVMTRRPDLAQWPGGLLLATKQYLLLGAPLLWRFARRRQHPWRFFLAAVAVVAFVTLPLALWQPRAFVDSVLLLQMREPFRLDSLSYLSWAARHGFGAGSFIWSIGAGAVALTAGVLMTPNTSAGFALTLALSAFATFAFGTKAFCNYYFFVVGALCCAGAAMGRNASGPSGRRDHRDGVAVNGSSSTSGARSPSPSARRVSSRR